MNLGFIKSKNTKKQVTKKIILYSGLILSANPFMNAYASTEMLDIRNIVIEERFEGQSPYISETIDTSDGGFLSIGSDYEAEILKHDKNGNLVWSNKLKGSKSVNFESVTELSDKSIVVVGYSKASDLGYEFKGGDNDAFIVKYSKDGQQEWIKGFGGSRDDMFVSVLNCPDGGFVVVGHSDSPDAGFTHNANYDTLIIKYDKNGNQEFMKQISGLSRDWVEDVKRTSDGGLIIAGYSWSNDIGFDNKGAYDVMLVKYNKNYNQEWIRGFGGSGRDYGDSVVETSDKGFVVSGHGNSTDAEYENPDGGNKNFLVKFDKNGNQEWIKYTIGNVYNLAKSNDGGIIFSCYGRVYKYDKDGNQVWVRYLGASIHRIVEISNKELLFYRQSSDYGPLMRIRYNTENDKYKDLADSIDGLTGEVYSSFESVIKASDGGFVAVGYSWSDIEYEDAIIVKYDRSGNQEWINSFVGSDEDYFYSVVETKDGGFVAVGYSWSDDIDYDCNTDYSAIIVKYDSNGNQLWAKNWGGSEYDEEFYSVIETSDGGIVVVGESYSDDAGVEYKGGEDAVIVKFDQNGSLLWAKSFGGSGNDYFNLVIETSDGGFVAVGNSYSTDAGFANKGNNDAIIVKYNSDGNQQWIKNFGGSDLDCFNSVVETQDGGFIAVGYSWSDDVDYDCDTDYTAIIVKYDSNGNQLWAKNWGGSWYGEKFYSVIETSDKGIVAVGENDSYDSGVEYKGDEDAVIVKFDQDGNLLWAKSFGGSEEDKFYSIIETQDGGFVAVGESDSVDAGFVNNGYDEKAIIVKYSSDGNEEWVETLKFDSPVDVDVFNDIRTQINAVVDNDLRKILNARLDGIDVDLGGLELKTASANLDIYIKCENMLLMSLDTNSITFEDFSGVEDMEKVNAVNISINSSLPYQLNAYLPTEIQNSDKSNTMDKRILNIKENSEADYKEFANINEKVVLKDNCPAGNDLVHGIDIKLKGGIAHEKDVYKTTIKFEAEQK